MTEQKWGETGQDELNLTKQSTAVKNSSNNE